MLSQNAFSQIPQIPTMCPPQINDPHSLCLFVTLALWNFGPL
jgi:hypothetical protein